MDALRFLQRLWALSHALERRSMNMERHLGITAQQRFLLRCIGATPGIAPGTLAELLCIDAGTVSAALRRVARAGLVERERDPLDRRRRHVRLTRRGEALARRLPGTVEASVVQLLAATAERDVRVMHEVVGRLTCLLETGLGDARPRRERRHGPELRRTPASPRRPGAASGPGRTGRARARARRG